MTEQNGAWCVSSVMKEFTDSFEILRDVGPAVSVFGSARLAPDDRYCRLAETCGRRLAERGFAVITGGGPGIMEAANKGAAEAGGTSVGLTVSLPNEQSANPHLDVEFEFNYFFVRKVCFVRYARGFVIFPGGVGTMDEFFESLTLMQTLKIAPFPVVAIGTDFWGELVTWMRGTMLERFGTIGPRSLELFHVTDDVEEAVEIISVHSGQAGGLS